MPKCKECGNTEKFILVYREAEVVTYEGDREIDAFSSGRARDWENFPPECHECRGIDIEGDIF